MQNYLECVGRLQDHSDILDDLRKDLLNQVPIGASMEELQIQTEECQVRNGLLRFAGHQQQHPLNLCFTVFPCITQVLESQLSRLGGALTADMDKSKELLNSQSEGIPEQIHQDLAATYLELESSFATATQMCAERSSSLVQAIESGRVSAYQHYQKYKD